jgi:hypothetical protein
MTKTNTRPQGLCYTADSVWTAILFLDFTRIRRNDVVNLHLIHFRTWLNGLSIPAQRSEEHNPYSLFRSLRLLQI